MWVCALAFNHSGHNSDTHTLICIVQHATSLAATGLAATHISSRSETAVEAKRLVSCLLPCHCYGPTFLCWMSPATTWTSSRYVVLQRSL